MTLASELNRIADRLDEAARLVSPCLRQTADTFRDDARAVRTLVQSAMIEAIDMDQYESQLVHGGTPHDSLADSDNLPMR